MTEMTQLIRKTEACVMNANEVLEQNTLKFLLTRKVPRKGIGCNGTETQSNGFKKEIETGVVQDVKEIAGKKYIVVAGFKTYIVDVI